MEGGGGVEWDEVGETPPDRRAEGARPVGSHHGSYQCVWYGFGPQMGRHMCHAGWLSQSTEPMENGDRWPDVVKSPPGGRWWAGGRLVIVGGPRQGACHGRGPGWWRACAMVASPPTPTPRCRQCQRREFRVLGPLNMSESEFAATIHNRRGAMTMEAARAEPHVPPQIWPPLYRTHRYDPWWLPTGPAPTRSRFGGVVTTFAHHTTTSTTPLNGATNPPSAR